MKYVKFKRDDLGLYVVFAILGSGLGLLVGSYIANRIENKRAEEEIIEPIEDIARTGSEKTVSKKREKKNQAKQLVGISEEEIEELLSRYTATPVQIEMLRSGLMSIDQFETVASELDGEEDEIIEPYDYRMASKPELSELVPHIPGKASRVEDEEDDLMDGWMVTLDKPGKNKYDREKFGKYDSSDGSLWRDQGGSLMQWRNCPIPEEVLDFASDMFSDSYTVYILDENNRFLYGLQEAADPYEEYEEDEPDELIIRPSRKGDDSD